GRERDDLRALRRDRHLLEGEVEPLLARREEAAERRAEVLDLADPELLGERLREVVLEAARVADRRAGGGAVPEAGSRQVEADGQRARLLRRRRCAAREGGGRRDQRRECDERDERFHVPSLLRGVRVEAGGRSLRQPREHISL